MATPDWRQAYARAVLAARMSVMNDIGVDTRVLSRMYDILAQAILDITQDAERGLISADRMEGLMTRITKRLAELSLELEDVLRFELDRAVRFGIEGHRQGVQLTNRILGINASANFNGAGDLAAELMLIRRGMAPDLTFRTLIRRHIVSLQSQVDDFLASAITRGVSAGRGSIELAAMMTGNDPRMVTHLSKLSRGKIHAGAIDAALDELAPAPGNYKQIRQLLYDARRIYVTEVNTAYREANNVAAARSPMVRALRWQVSGRHFSLPSTPDVCTIYFETDQFGVGQGTFPIASLPSTPHPFCGCHAIEVLKAPKEFAQPAIQPSPPRKLVDADLAAMFQGRTPRHLQTQVDLANLYNSLAYQAWKKYATKAA